MSDEIFYPGEIYDQWKEAIDQSGLPTHDEKAIMQVVRYVQPPLSIKSLKNAVEVFGWDHDDLDLKGAIQNLSSNENIPFERPRKIGSLYPVFFAMTNPRFLGTAGDHKYSLGRQLINDWFSDLTTGLNTSRHNFYSHVLAVRHVLMAVIGADYQADKEAEKPDKFFYSAIRSDALYSQRRQLDRSYQIFTEIYQDELSPGELIRRSPGGRRGGAQKKREKTDDWHDVRVKKLASVSPPKRTRVSQPPDPDKNQKADELADTEATVLGFHPISTSTAADNAEENEQPVLQRKTSSALTPSDDRKIVQRWINSAATASLSTVNDLSRLTPEKVKESLAVSLKPIEYALAVLLLTTGMPVKRIITLETLSEDDVDIAAITKDHPIFFPETNELWYRLLDGPGANKSNKDKYCQWVILKLPDILATALSDPEPSQHDRPFRGVLGELNRKLKNNFRRHAGIIPTANRLRATSWLWRRPHARDDVAAEMLTGQFGLTLSAPAAYRSIPRTEVQHVFTHTIKSLGIIYTDTKPNSTEVKADSNSDGNTVGSAVAQPPCAFLPLFAELREAMGLPIDELAMWWSGQEFPRRSLIALYQYVAAYHLLAWQLSTGARPIGPESQNTFSGKWQWLHDKNSARGVESRVIPLLTDIKNALFKLQCWTDALLRQLRDEDITVEDRRTSDRNTPDWLEEKGRSRRLILRDMCWSDLQSLPLTTTKDLADNVARHSLASWLRERVSDAEVDALLGHASDGRSLSSVRAEATINHDGGLRRRLNNWLKLCGYKSLKWEKLPWHD
ncbi:hypothetical protein GCM10022228_07730 [Halomonas cibimaris]|uniref:Tyr recombinase domain-containing protein n=1 Tax=Halomonas cibimaris TaxID=657012 RepID=A0ABP7LF10_9GAMM